MTNPLNIIILAAGQGKRMYSQLPKVLHELAGRPLLAHVLATAEKLQPKKIIVVHGHGGDIVKQRFMDATITWVHQVEQLGTGHAVLQALPHLDANAQVLILAGDVPLVSSATLQALLHTTAIAQLGIVTAHVTNPTGLGRILRDTQQHIQGIIEERDATPEQKLNTEIYAGILATSTSFLANYLPQLSQANAQQEYYLTELIMLAVRAGITVNSVNSRDVYEIVGVNDRHQLAELERNYQYHQAQQLAVQGVSLRDPTRFDLRGELTIGADVIIDINVLIEGKVGIADACYIGPNVVLRNCQIGQRVRIEANSIIENSNIGDDCVVGPFARLRPGTQLANHVEIGNFIEIKNSQIGAYTKAHHVGYLGDAEIGQRVNIGAGTITANYDGAYKHKTVLGDQVFIGCDSILVAPVTVESGATIGAGSVITKTAPADTLTVARAKQTTIAGWQRPVKDSKQ